jgi:S-adenosylmethionine uptake transporter
MTATPAPPIQIASASTYAVGLIGIASFSIMDAVMKGLTLELGAFNAMFWRSIIALSIATPLYLFSTIAWPSRKAFRLHLLRGSIAGVMAFTFFWGIARVPLAEGIALSFIAPLVAIYLSAIFLGEKVTPRALSASVLSLAGVIVIAAARATGEFSEDALWGLGSIMVSACLYACNIVLMRAQAQSAKPAEIAFWQNAVVVVQLGILAFWFAEVPAAIHFAGLTAAAALTVFSLFTLAWAYARSETQHLVSTEYTAFIWASILGYWFFGERVEFSTLFGCALIVGGCLIATRPAKGEA